MNIAYKKALAAFLFHCLLALHVFPSRSFSVARLVMFFFAFGQTDFKV